MDYLPIQALSVPSQHVLSSSVETDTKKRNRISPTLMEALQMLKYDFKKRRLTFTEGMKLDHRSLVDDEPNEPAGGDDLDEPVDIIISHAGREEGDQIEAEIVFVDF